MGSSVDIFRNGIYLHIPLRVFREIQIENDKSNLKQ